MSISSIGSQQQLYQLELAAGLVSAPSSGTTQAAQSTGVSPTTSTPAAGGLGQSILQALGQSGVTTSTAPASTSTDPAQALQSFMQALAAALQSQGSGASQTSASTSGASGQSSDTTQAAAGVQGHTGHHHHGMGGALQSLIWELDDPASTTTGAAVGAATNGGAANGAAASLQQSFQNLLGSLGSNASVSLSSVLTNLSSDLSGADATGNLISTQA